MFIPDHDIEVNYYKVKEGTPLHDAITSYHEKCEAFVAQATQLVEKYQADSAVRLLDFFNMRVSGLNFTDENAPLHWHMDGFGHFSPKWTSQDSKDFDVELLHFSEHYRKAPAGLRFGQLGDSIVISVTPNKDGSVSRVDDADLLDDTEIEALKATASDAQIEHFASLGRSEWSPLPLTNQDVFKPSDEVIALNEERFNFDNNWLLNMKHSQTGRAVRRGLQKLGL